MPARETPTSYLVTTFELRAGKRTIPIRINNHWPLVYIYWKELVYIYWNKGRGLSIILKLDRFGRSPGLSASSYVEGSTT